MTKKLSELFDLPDNIASTNLAESSEVLQTIADNREAIARVDEAIDKIDLALPTVRDLEASDEEMDELADLAKSKFEDLMDLGMNMDPRFGGVVFQTAGTLLGHAITAKTAKMDKKLKMIDLQLKKMRLDQQGKNSEGPDIIPTAQGTVLSRNDLLERILASNKENTKRE